MVIWFTGLSGAGKSTLAYALASRLSQLEKPVQVLDGDEIRKKFPELGFSKRDRDEQVNRVANLAQELTQSGHIVLVALISPFEQTRLDAFSRITNLKLVYVSTPLSTCEKRDPKQLYAKARRGEIKQMTGLDDPYEAPQDCAISIDTTHRNIDDCVDVLFNRLFGSNHKEFARA